MSAQIIDGKALAAATKAEAAAEAAALKAKGIEPCLAVILVGENPASQVYVRGKVKDCGECGIKSLELRMPETTTQEELLAKIAELAADKIVNGILVQLPLPKQIDERAVIDRKRTWTVFPLSTWAVCRPASPAFCPAPRRAASA